MFLDDMKTNDTLELPVESSLCIYLTIYRDKFNVSKQIE